VANVKLRLSKPYATVAGDDPVLRRRKIRMETVRRALVVVARGYVYLALTMFVVGAISGAFLVQQGYGIQEIGALLE
jgi:hypothetical protein